MIGRKIGRYQILKAIGEGGMARVYLAEDTNLERQVALKMIRIDMIPPQQLPRLLERFKREAKALAQLSDDPAIVTVHDYGEFEGTPYLVMAYMPGGTLKDMLGKPLDYRKAAQMLIPVARALGEAHAHGIIHRDVKPSNLLVDKRGQLALADFGIAKALEVDGQTLTGTGMGVGTPEYMAPEQWKGEATPQTDVYSLGVVLYEMVTGRKPFSAGTPSEVFLKQMTEAPARPRALVPGLPGAVEDVLDRAMAKEPSGRYGDMADLQRALEGILQAESAHDETPVAAVLPKAPDPEETYDDLATPAESVWPTGVQPQEKKNEQPRAIPEAQAREKKSNKRSWLLAGGLIGLGLMGVAVVAGLVWWVVAVMEGKEQLGVLATEKAMATATMTATKTKIAAETMTKTANATAIHTFGSLSNATETQITIPKSIDNNLITSTPAVLTAGEFAGKIAYISSNNGRVQLFLHEIEKGVHYPFEQITSSKWEYDDYSLEYIDERLYWNDDELDLICTGYCNVHRNGTLFSKIGGQYGWGYSVPIGCNLLASDVKCPTHTDPKCTCCKSYFCSDSYSSVFFGGSKHFIQGNTKNYYPIWSPQGDKFAYLTLGQGDVDIIIEGNNYTDSIKGEISTIAWSMDGNRIAFAYKEALSGPRNICFVDLPLKELRCLTNNSMDEAYPSWSHDGKTIAFSRNDGNDFEIVLINVENTQEKQITDNEVDDIYPLWSVY